MQTLETARLALRPMCDADAAFILQLQNDPAWLRWIGDRGLRTLDDAREYIRTGPVAMYAELGYGFRIVALRDSGQPMGLCGIAKRPHLDAPDIGFALLPAFHGQGYAYEAADAVLHNARHVLRLPRIVATTRPDNSRSIALLRKLGLRFHSEFLHPDGDRMLALYAVEYR